MTLVEAARLIDGPINGERFRSYVEEARLPLDSLPITRRQDQLCPCGCPTRQRAASRVAHLPAGFALCQIVEQCLCRSEIGRREAFGKSIVYRR